MDFEPIVNDAHKRNIELLVQLPLIMSMQVLTCIILYCIIEREINHEASITLGGGKYGRKKTYN